MVTISTIINGTVRLADNFKIEKRSGNAVLIRDTNENYSRYSYVWIHKNNIIDNKGINVRYNAYIASKWFFGAFNAQ